MLLLIWLSNWVFLFAWTLHVFVLGNTTDKCHGRHCYFFCQKCLCIWYQTPTIGIYTGLVLNLFKISTFLVNTAISKHEFLSKFRNCPLVFCSHPLYYAIQALCDIFQCSLCIQRMWIAVSTNKFIWGTNYIQLLVKKNIRPHILFRNSN